MNASDRENWNFEAINEILIAISKNKSLKEYLVFKGAAILYRRIATQRKSLDLDSNLREEFIQTFPQREQQISFLSANLENALYEHFETQNPVRYALEAIRISPSTKAYHPRGWNGYDIKIALSDSQNIGVRGLPTLSIDLSAPENYTKQSLSELKIGKHTIPAYSLERIAGEKMRAYLMSLPTYREKVERRERAIRVKDLYDLALISRKKNIKNNPHFWIDAGNEFRIACESRYVDCNRIATFKENWNIVKEEYKRSPIFTQDITFGEVSRLIDQIFKLLRQEKIIPFSFPIQRNLS